jgi:hypothetical protein
MRQVSVLVLFFKRVFFGCVLWLSAFGFVSTSCLADVDDDGEGIIIEDKTSAFKGTQLSAQEQLAKTDFFNSLKPFSLEARAANLTEIKDSVTMPNLGQGDPQKKYQVILQPGHYGRTSGGNLGTSGKKISEQKLVAFITANVAKYLIDNGVDVLVISADNYKSGLKTDVFLSIHADGSKKKCSTGPSLGYKMNSNLLGMHSVGFALAASMGQSYDDFMKDNFTVNLHEYYMFKHIDTSGYGGLLEIGELTCPEMENQLIANALLIAQNLGVALKSSIDILNEPHPN